MSKYGLSLWGRCCRADLKLHIWCLSLPPRFHHHSKEGIDGMHHCQWSMIVTYGTLFLSISKHHTGIECCVPMFFLNIYLMPEHTKERHKCKLSPADKPLGLWQAVSLYDVFKMNRRESVFMVPQKDRVYLFQRMVTVSDAQGSIQNGGEPIQENPHEQAKCVTWVLTGQFGSFITHSAHIHKQDTSHSYGSSSFVNKILDLKFWEAFVLSVSVPLTCCFCQNWTEAKCAFFFFLV